MSEKDPFLPIGFIVAESAFGTEGPPEKTEIIKGVKHIGGSAPFDWDAMECPEDATFTVEVRYEDPSRCSNLPLLIHEAGAFPSSDGNGVFRWVGLPMDRMEGMTKVAR